MFVSDSLDVNREGHLLISGADTVSLAQKYGTPLYVMSEDGIRKNCRSFKDAVDKYYNGNGMILYASKAFCCKEMCRIVDSEGLGIDVVSNGELQTALSTGFPAEKIYFHGNNKQYYELENAIKAGIGGIIADNFEELSEIDEISKKYGKIFPVILRIKPGVDAHTHDFIKTGQIDSKFGFALENGEAFDAVKSAVSFENIDLSGLHCHIGSQIFDVAPFEESAKIMVEFISKIKNELGVSIKKLNLGGGFGIKYLENDGAIPFEDFIKSVSETLKNECKKHQIDIPFIMMEPGRSIVGSEGITLYTVGAIKNIPNIRKFVSIDGGMSDNPRYALYNAEYSAVIANRVNQKKDDVVTIAGKCCESGDLIQENCPIQTPKKGDILAVFSTGAYNYSMSSNYNRIEKPPVVMISRGEDRVIIKKETTEDLMRNDI